MMSYLLPINDWIGEYTFSIKKGLSKIYVVVNKRFLLLSAIGYPSVPRTSEKIYDFAL